MSGARTSAAEGGISPVAAGGFSLSCASKWGCAAAGRGPRAGLRAAHRLGAWILACLAALGPALPAPAGESADPRAIMEAVRDRSEGKTRSATLEMTLVDPGGKERKRRLHAFLKE